MGPVGILVRFSGTVQGVGFRRRTLRIAETFPVAGYVRNLDDGRVELVLEGSEAECERCLTAVSTAMEREIDVQTRESVAPAGLSEFKIRY